MRVIKLHSTLRDTLPAAIAAGLWVLERRARAGAEEALRQLEERLHGLARDNSSLVRENARLIELDGLKSKFVADAAHELRTPITSLNLRLYLLEHAPAEQRPRYLDEFRQQLDRLARLTSDLLTISRLDSLDAPDEFVPVDLNQVAEEVVIAYRPLAEAAGLTLITEYTPGLPSVRGEHRQLVQVGANLVSNAIHYTPSGHVLISTLLDVAGACVSLQVQDTGIGIVADDLPHIFERFYRGAHDGRPPVEGTGLGLSIVKEIVDLHGGTIEVHSRAGEGTTVRVRFPLDGVMHF